MYHIYQNTHFFAKQYDSIIQYFIVVTIYSVFDVYLCTYKRGIQDWRTGCVPPCMNSNILGFVFVNFEGLTAHIYFNKYN